MVRSIDGQGCVMASSPPPTGTSAPAESSSAVRMPGNACVADPGLVVVIPGSGVIMMAPVSVCHHVSTMGHRACPTTWWYHIHASGLMGSPTDPSSRSRERSCFATWWSPHFMNARMAVGAV